MHHPIKSLAKLLSLFGVIALVAAMAGPAPSHAQARSATSGINSENLAQASCTNTVRRLEVLVRELEEFAEDLQACNDAGQVFNGANCVALARIEHEWVPNEANPLQLVFRDNGTEVARVNVIQGRDGEDATCSEDPEDPVDPVDPPDPDPRDCTAPWGATVAHRGSVTAYETSSVPDGNTCNDERRTCNDGTLSGSFTHQTCEVDDPEPEPEPTCTWQSRGQYGTQPGVMMAYMDLNCGAINPVPCQGCTPFRAQTCTPGAACSGRDELPCLINERSCRAQNGDATVWDRYQCLCR